MLLNVFPLCFLLLCVAMSVENKWLPVVLSLTHMIAGFDKPRTHPFILSLLQFVCSSGMHFRYPWWKSSHTALH